MNRKGCAMKWQFFLMMVVLSVMPMSVDAQMIDTTGCYLREPSDIGLPVLRQLKVEPVVGGIRLVWQMDDLDAVAGFCICCGSPCLSLDTLWSASDTVFVDTSHSGLQPLRYAVFAIDSCFHGGALSDPVFNWVLSADVDVCAHRVALRWQSLEVPEGTRFRVRTDDGVCVDSLWAPAVSTVLQFDPTVDSVRLMIEAETELWTASSNWVSVGFARPGDCPPNPDEEDTSAVDPLTVVADPWLPTCFTPMLSDNNCFRPVFSDVIAPQQYHLRIFNRGGMMLYESTDPAAGWNGCHRGEVAEQGVYVYVVDYRSAGRLLQKRGTLLLLR